MLAGLVATPAIVRVILVVAEAEEAGKGLVKLKM